MQVKIIQESIRGDIPQNFYVAADDEKGAILLPPPGLQSFLTLPFCSQIRGMKDFENYIYAVAVQGNTSKVYKIDLGAGYTDLGTINSGLGPVWIENNNYQIAFNDGTTGQDLYVYNIQTGVFGQVTDADFPGASSLAYQDGYGIITMPDSLRWYISASYDFTSWGALDFVSKEGQADKVLTIISDHREVWPLGSKTGEIWQNTGAAAFPFERLAGGLVEEGCGASKSLVKVDNSVAWITSKGQIVKIDGYQPKIISNRKIEREIQGYATFADAVGFAFTWMGHLQCAWYFPTANTTIVFDVATKIWWRWATGHEENRHRANCYCTLNGRHFVGDFQNGTIWELKDTVYADGDEITRRKFYFQVPTPEEGWLSFPYLQLDWDQGVGLEDTSIPQTMLRISDNGGKTWSSEWWEEAGQIGEYGMRTRYNRLGGIGNHQERMYEIAVTDAVNWRLLGIKHPIIKG